MATTSYLQGISLVRRNSEWHHFDPLGTAGVITNGSAQVVSNNLYDVFGVLRYQQGSAETPWRWVWQVDAEEDLVYAQGQFYLPSRACSLLQPRAAVTAVIIAVCALACVWSALEIYDRIDRCQQECRGSDTPVTCWAGCLLEACKENMLNLAACATCGCCIATGLRLPIAKQLCKYLWDIVKKILPKQGSKHAL